MLLEYPVIFLFPSACSALMTGRRWRLYFYDALSNLPPSFRSDGAAVGLNPRVEGSNMNNLSFPFRNDSKSWIVDYQRHAAGCSVMKKHLQ